MSLNYIFHVSDIHIRHGDRHFCRYDEYCTVFERLFTSICAQKDILKLKPSEFVIILSGDIFHNKNVVGNYGLMLYKKLVQGLTNIGKTIIFHGNHDRNQNEIDQPSLVSSTIEIQNLLILDKTISFNIDNVGFSYVSIDDTLDSYKTCGRIDKLPPFPSINDAKHKVALFHGTFAHVKLYNGQEVAEEFGPYPFEWIQDFDYAVLGDIHLRQKGLYNKKTLWGYSGSLIQQNYGEDVVHHGYMIWNLEKRTIKEINVYNDNGFVNLKEENDIIMIRKRGKYINLEDMIKNNLEMFPKNIEIKIYSTMNFSKLYELLAKYNINANIISSKIPVSLKYLQTCFKKHEDEFEDITINKNTLIQHFRKNLSEQQHSLLSAIIMNNDKLLFDIDKYPEELHEECYKKNKELSVLITNCSKSDDIVNNRPPFSIQYIEWENLYCYESNNHINFDNTSCSTFMIGGNNGTGKSAIYDIITLAIWGDTTTSKQSSISNGVIHYKHSKAYTSIVIEIDETIYKIRRTFGKQSGKNTLIKSIILYKYNDSKYEVLKKDNSCSDIIKALFGSLEEFLSSSMITQNVDFDLLKMDYKDCVSIIDKATNIDYVYNLYTLFKSSLNKYKDFRKVIDNKKQVYERLCNGPKTGNEENNNDTNLNTDLLSLQIMKKKLEYDNNSIAVDVNHENNHKILAMDLDSTHCETGLTITKEEYSELQKRYYELKYILQNEKEIDNEDIVLNDAPVKPCEFSVIESESKILDNLDNVYEEYSITELEELLKINNAHKTENSQTLTTIECTKPIPVEVPNCCIENITEMIDNFYGNIENLTRCCGKTVCYDREKRDFKTYTEYIEKNLNVNTLNQNILETKNSLRNVEQTLNDLYEKRRNLKEITQPIEENFETFKQPNKKKDLQSLQKQINNNDIKLEKYYASMDNILEQYKRLEQYHNELKELETTCEYDPNCRYCCKQPWILRMQELRNQTKAIQLLIDRFYENDVDYLSLYIKNASLKWIIYNNFLKEKEWIEDQINECSEKRILYTQQIIEHEKELQEITNFLHEFYEQSDVFMKSFTYYNYCKNYNDWFIQHEIVYVRQKHIENTILSITKCLDYRPRLEKINQLKVLYAQWEKDNRAYITTRFKEMKQIEEKKTVFEYQQMKVLKDNILKKMEICQKLKDVDRDIKNISDKITRNQTVYAVNEKNYQNYHMLEKSLYDINEIIDVIEILIDKFKVYRKDIYQNVILKRLTKKANDYLDKICHSDTKKFEISYILTELKDLIHVNWLIKTKNEELEQTVSVSQASGFQHFVISLALRMSLFGNRQCKQLFFDEGFTACDKLNLSVVPSFLKGLLQIFDSIIIVSHIDIIKDSVDMSTVIEYNKETKGSKIQYGVKI